MHGNDEQSHLSITSESAEENTHVEKAAYSPSSGLNGSSVSMVNTGDVQGLIGQTYGIVEPDTHPTVPEGVQDGGNQAQPCDSVNSNNELQRLRELVFQSRGSKSQLPAGWEDAPPEDSGENVASASAQPSRDSDLDPIVGRAIEKVGAELLSSEGSSDSEDSSSEASSSSDDADEAPAEISGDHSDDDEGFGSSANGRGPMTKNEVLEPTVDPPPFPIVPLELEIRPLGKVHSIVDCVVVVSQNTGSAPGSSSQPLPAPIDRTGKSGEQHGEYSVLDTGSLLAFPDRNVLGVVYETFGSVLTPLYALRYPSAQHVNQDQIVVGKEVWYVPSHSTYVLTRALRAMGKGSDASNIWDEEVAAEEQDFSDDEQEATHKRALKGSKNKNKKRAVHDADKLTSQMKASESFAPIHGDIRVSGMQPSRAYPLPYEEEARGNHSFDTSLLHGAHGQLHRPGQQGRGRGRGRGRGVAMNHASYAYSAAHLGTATSSPQVYGQGMQHTMQPLPPYHGGQPSQAGWNANYAAAVAHNYPTQVPLANSEGYDPTQPSLSYSYPWSQQ